MDRCQHPLVTCGAIEGIVHAVNPGRFREIEALQDKDRRLVDGSSCSVAVVIDPPSSRLVAAVGLIEPQVFVALAPFFESCKIVRLEIRARAPSDRE
jgi:hypothetical protein